MAAVTNTTALAADIAHSLEDEPILELPHIGLNASGGAGLTSPIVGSPVASRRSSVVGSEKASAAIANATANAASGKLSSVPHDSHKLPLPAIIDGDLSELDKGRVVVAGGITLSLTPSKSPRGNSFVFASPLSPSVRRSSQVDASALTLAKAAASSSALSRLTPQSAPRQNPTANGTTKSASNSPQKSQLLRSGSIQLMTPSMSSSSAPAPFGVAEPTRMKMDEDSTRPMSSLSSIHLDFSKKADNFSRSPMMSQTNLPVPFTSRSAASANAQPFLATRAVRGSQTRNVMPVSHSNFSSNPSLPPLVANPAFLGGWAQQGALGLAGYPAMSSDGSLPFQTGVTNFDQIAQFQNLLLNERAMLQSMPELFNPVDPTGSNFAPVFAALGTMPPAVSILRRKAQESILVPSILPLPALPSRRRSSISYLALPPQVGNDARSMSSISSQARMYALLLKAPELEAVANFFESLLCIGGFNDAEMLREFKIIVVDLMAERFSGLWDPLNPEKDVSIRTITHSPHLGETYLDPLLQTAFVLLNIHPRFMLDLMPVSFTLYVMPGKVAYTTPEFNSAHAVVLYESQPSSPQKTLDPVDHGADIRRRAFQNLTQNPESFQAFDIDQYFGGSTSKAE